MTTDKRVVFAIVGFIGAIAVISLALTGALAYQGKGIPDAIVATLSGSLSALAALLAKTSTEPAP